MKSKLFTITSVVCMSFILFALPVQAQGGSWTGACVGGPKNDVATILGIECLIANVLAVIMTLLGITAFIMFLVGSFRWLTAGANSKGVEGGRNAISFAIIGIVVALSSFVILRLISNFTGVNNLMQFNTQIDDINRR